MLISIDQHKTPSDIQLGVLRQLMLWKGPWLPESETHVRRLPQDSTWEEALRSLRDRLLNIRTMRPDIERLSRLWVKQNENFYCYMERWFDLWDCIMPTVRCGNIFMSSMYRVHIKSLKCNLSHCICETSP